MRPNYRNFLLKHINANHSVRDYRRQLASVASVHPSYISQVLSGKANLTPDQAMALCRFWKLDRHETDYFLILLDLERAKSQELRKHLEQKIFGQPDGNGGESIHGEKQNMANFIVQFFNSLEEDNDLRLHEFKMLRLSQSGALLVKDQLENLIEQIPETDDPAKIAFLVIDFRILQDIE